MYGQWIFLTYRVVAMSLPCLFGTSIQKCTNVPSACTAHPSLRNTHQTLPRVVFRKLRKPSLTRLRIQADAEACGSTQWQTVTTGYGNGRPQ